MKDIYKVAIKTMRPEDIIHWCSDLYLRVTPESEELVNNYEYKKIVTTFIDDIDHVLWYEIPFAYYGEGWRG